MIDAEIAATLDRIERYSTWLTSDAETVRRNVRVLRSRPGFETKANAAMQLAKTRLESALNDVDAALSEYSETVTA